MTRSLILCLHGCVSSGCQYQCGWINIILVTHSPPPPPLSVCLCQSVCLSARLSVCLSLSVFLSLSVCFSVCLSLSLSCHCNFNNFSMHTITCLYIFCEIFPQISLVLRVFEHTRRGSERAELLQRVNFAFV